MLSPTSRPVPLWAWPTLLSLDAPVVAVAWLLAFGRVYGPALPPSAALLLGLSVWLVYSADRVLDSARLSSERPPTLRHAFAAAQRRTLTAAWLAVLALDLILALLTLDAATLILGVALASGAGLYLVTLHAPTGTSAAGTERLRAWLAHRWVQHLQVGLLFAAAVALFAWRDLDASWLPPLLLFAALCSLNCAFIAAWERPFDDGRAAGTPPASAVPRRGALALALLMLAAFALSGNPLPLAGAAAALTLRAIDHHRHGIEANLLRTLADGALIAPLLLPLW